MKTVIMAGGKGTRAASIADNIPKPMIPICGKPILEYQIECLKRNGLTDIVLVIGHLGQYIKDYFKNGEIFGCNISYFEETQPLGTAGALFKIKDLSDDFLLLNGDVILDMDFSRMAAFHKNKKADSSYSAFATLAVHPNSHPFDSSLIASDRENRITCWLNKEDERTYYKNCVNAGVHILSVEFLKSFKLEKEKIDLDRDMLKPNIQSGRIYAYSTPEYIKDMGTPERYAQVTGDIEKGIVAGKNLHNRQKCVFLDRDGTINIYDDFVRKPENFHLIQGVANAIKTINNLGFLVIVITNQPVIARGEVDFDTLDSIHLKMETDLGKEGAYIDDLFYCPHHPDKGFEGERPEYKMICDCRKPKPGMIFDAAKKFNIDLSKSYMAGDHNRDIECAVNAGCKPVFILSGEGKAEDIKISNTEVFENLIEFAEYLKDKNNE